MKMEQFEQQCVNLGDKIYRQNTHTVTVTHCDWSGRFFLSQSKAAQQSIDSAEVECTTFSATDDAADDDDDGM